MNHSPGKTAGRAGVWSRTALQTLVGAGSFAHAQWDELRHAAAVIGTVLFLAVQPRYWTRAIWRLSARQVLAVGVEPLGFVCGVAVFVGISVVVQLASWTGKAGQSQMLGPLLVAVVARELGPLLTNIVVIVRSNSAMATELGVLKINGEVRGLEAQGNDPFLHLVMPRVLGVAVSTLCLTIVFILVALFSGYLFGAWLGTGSRDFWFFTDTVVNALNPRAMAGILAKSILPALFTSASCCIGGLSVGESVTDIPHATQRALTRSIAGLFVISAVVSLLTYL
jgi:phospholipid/cholesterol/gamma-HCH transport system permease protein